jgi:hypothetical protein
MTPTDKPQHPSWWTADHAAGWESARPSVKDSWGKQAEAGKGSASEGWTEAEPAVRFGHGARRHYDTTGKVTWTEAEPKLQADWGKLSPARSWAQARSAVMHGWNSHTRAGLHATAATETRTSPSGFGSGSAGDSGSGSGDA